MRIAEEDIRRAEQMDLLTYLQIYEPNNLKRVAGNEYCTLDHDSLRISNGKWHWYSKGIGGYNAIQYLMKVREISFPDAVRQVLQLPTEEYYAAIQSARKHIPQPQEQRVFAPPARNYNHNRAIAYLEGRGISRDIIFHCIQNRTLYESQKYHNVVFIGMDVNGVPRYGNIRSTFDGEKSFKGECAGSDKRFAFQLVPKEMSSNSLHVFEASIDALSFATYAKLRGAPWQTMNLLALGGVSGSNQKVPLALEQFLKDHPEINSLYLHLDNDIAGRNATKNIENLLKDKYEIRDIPPQSGKDVNDFLKMYQSSVREKAVQQREAPTV